jgi:hypothetical protein
MAPAAFGPLPGFRAVQVAGVKQGSSFSEEKEAKRLL